MHRTNSLPGGLLHSLAFLLLHTPLTLDRNSITLTLIFIPLTSSWDSSLSAAFYKQFTVTFGWLKLPTRWSLGFRGGNITTQPDFLATFLSSCPRISVPTSALTREIKGPFPSPSSVAGKYYRCCNALYKWLLSLIVRAILGFNSNAQALRSSGEIPPPQSLFHCRRGGGKHVWMRADTGTHLQRSRNSHMRMHELLSCVVSGCRGGEDEMFGFTPPWKMLSEYT